MTKDFWYPDWVRWRFGVALKGTTVHGKVKLLICVTLQSIPRRVRERLPQRVKDGMERLADKLVANQVVKVGDVEFVLVDSESLTIISPLFEAWSPLRVRKGEVFLDVGAHIGKYSLFVAKTVRDSLVVSVEPQPVNYQALKKGVELNGLHNVIPVNVAAWKEKCPKELFIGKKTSGHTVKPDRKKPVHHSGVSVVVEAEPLDSVLQKLNIAKVDWIKIDVEGAELEALHGLKKTLKNHPTLIIESSRHREVMKFLRQFGYISSLLAQDNFLFWFPEKWVQLGTGGIEKMACS
jgi:FkbM family methyltransferase